MYPGPAMQNCRNRARTPSETGMSELGSVAILNSVGSFVNPVFCCPKNSPQKLVTCAKGQVTDAYCGEHGKLDVIAGKT